MPEVNYDKFYTGISEDDIISTSPQIVEGNNVTGMNTGYGITLGPKVNKQLLTNGNAARTIFGRELSSGVLTSIAVGCDTGEIYKLTSTDNTPIYTLTTGWNILNGALLLKGSNFMYFASRNTSAGSTSFSLMQVTLADFNSESFTSANEAFLSFNNIGTPPMAQNGTFLYVGGLNTVYRIDSAGTIVPSAIFNRYVVGITRHGTRFYVYTDSGEVAIWDGVSGSISASFDLGFTPSRVTAESGIDHVISSVGDKYVVGGYEASLVMRKKLSDRLDDNSQFIKKLDFTPDSNTGNALETERGGVFIISSDTKPGIYRQDKLIEGLGESFHKSITKDNLGIDFDEVFTLKAISKGQSKLFFGFQSGTTSFGVDYIDLDSKETAKDGYFVTQVWRGPPNKVAKTIERRLTTMNVSGSNYIKLYVRLDNGSWTEIRDTTDINNFDKIFRDRIKGTSGGIEYVDLQFKCELHNETQAAKGPIVQALSELYTVIKDN